MRLARATIIFSLIGCIALLGWHWMGLPAHPVGGWFFAPKVSKEAYFKISDTPFNQDTWSSRWGRNRPKSNRAHAILSELEIRVQHETRSALMRVTVVGDSKEEVDAFIHTLQADVKNTYTPDDFMLADHGYSHGTSEEYEPTHFWRQRYLWLLCANALIFIVLLASTRAKTNNKQNKAEEPTPNPPFD